MKDKFRLLKVDCNSYSIAMSDSWVRALADQMRGQGTGVWGDRCLLEPNTSSWLWLACAAQQISVVRIVVTQDLFSKGTQLV